MKKIFVILTLSLLTLLGLTACNNNQSQSENDTLNKTKEQLLGTYILEKEEYFAYYAEITINEDSETNSYYPLCFQSWAVFPSNPVYLYEKVKTEVYFNSKLENWSFYYNFHQASVVPAKYIFMTINDNSFALENSEDKRDTYTFTRTTLTLDEFKNEYLVSTEV